MSLQYSGLRFTFGTDVCIDIYPTGVALGSNDVVLSREQMIEIAAGIRCVAGHGGDFQYPLEEGRELAFSDKRVYYENEYLPDGCDAIALAPGELEGIAKAFEFMVKKGGAQ